LLESKLNTLKPGLVIFTFKKSAEVMFGRFRGNGFEPDLNIAGADVFVMPGPYEDAAKAAATLTKLSKRLAQ
jgi:hypothetical protein